MTSDAGTGVVHTAPAHGLEDFGTCERARVPVGPVLVDDGGRFTTEAGPAFAGLDVLGDGNAMVISELNRIGALLHEESYSHRYMTLLTLMALLTLFMTILFFQALCHLEFPLQPTRAPQAISR